MSLDSPSAAPILVVEDDEQVARFLHDLLEGQGYACILAGNASQADRLLDQHDSELVLCDISLPGASGLDLTRHVVGAHPNTAVVMVSALDDPRIAADALALGAYGYIIKPFTPNELLIGVANALRRRSLEIESRARAEELEQLVQLRTAALNRSHLETIRRLAWAAEFRDEETGRHIERVSRLADLLAEQVGLQGERRELVRLASPLHDVGKIGIPDRILLKPGSLSANEWAVMRTHPEIGCSLLRDSGAELLDVAAVIALTHHERMDGTGYPHGLSAEQIPLEGRIAAVADVFDALTSERVYRPALPPDEALAAMRAGRGTQFDAGLLDLFLDAVDDVVAIVEAPSPPAQALLLAPAP